MKPSIRPIQRELMLAGMLLAACTTSLWASGEAGSSATSQGAGFSADSLHYLHDFDNDCALLTYAALDTANANAYSGSLVVPSYAQKPDGGSLPVKGVTAVACVFCQGLQSVSLSEGIETIGYAAFSDCTGLTEANLPSSLTTLGDLSFYRDLLLERISVPQGVRRVGDGTFGFCYALCDVELPEGVSSIAPHAFYHCSSLTTIELPSTLRQLGQYAFAYCSALNKIRIHTNPLAITEDVFEGVDRSQCQLVVPHNFYDDFAAAPVWRDFVLVDSGENGLEEVISDDSDLMQIYVIGDVLHVRPLGDAPVLVYDLHGRRVALCAAGSGDNGLYLDSGQTYIVRCGCASRKVSI